MLSTLHQPRCMLLQGLVPPGRQVPSADWCSSASSRRPSAHGCVPTAMHFCPHAPATATRSGGLGAYRQCPRQTFHQRTAHKCLHLLPGGVSVRFHFRSSLSFASHNMPMCRAWLVLGFRSLSLAFSRVGQPGFIYLVPGTATGRSTVHFLADVLLSQHRNSFTLYLPCACVGCSALHTDAAEQCANML